MTLLSSTCVGGKGHSGDPSYSSSGLLIKEDEQKTISGSLLSECQSLECGLGGKIWGMEWLGTGKGWGLKNRKKEKIFIMLMKKKEKIEA